MQRLRWTFVAVLVAVVALSVGAATAAAGGGNSPNVKLCQHGGWKTLQGIGGLSFGNQGACVAYAARGGAFVTFAKDQADCESIDGTFSTDPSTDTFHSNAVLLWSCNGWPFADVDDFFAKSDPIGNDCVDDGGTASIGTEVNGVPPGNISCYVE